jgi:uncharacterized membrane protein
LQEDPTTQKTLATFLGAFVFAIVAVIGLNASYYDSGARVILFAASILVMTIVVLALLRWIGYLQDFGRMENILDRVEDAARTSLSSRLDMPYMGGHPHQGSVPDGAVEVAAQGSGYVQHIDMNALQDWAEEAGAQVWITAMPGDFLYPGAQLLCVLGTEPDAKACDAIQDAFSVERQRSYDQDPRHGMVVLSEIAQRALSPSVNDPGTAIAVIDRELSVLLEWQVREGPEVMFEALHVPSVEPAQMIDAAFRPIVRDAGGHSEVIVRLLLAFRALSSGAPEVFTAPVESITEDLDDRIERSNALSEWDMTQIESARGM